MNELNPYTGNNTRWYSHIGHSVRWYREEHLKISDLEFANQVGIPLTVLRQIEAGDCEHCLGELIVISMNSDFPLDDVLDDVCERIRLHTTGSDTQVAQCLHK